MKQKIKKLMDKFEKVDQILIPMGQMHVSHTLRLCQDSSKIVDIEKESEKSAILIPKLEENIPELQKLLVEEEKVLEEVIEHSKGGT